MTAQFLLLCDTKMWRRASLILMISCIACLQVQARQLSPRQQATLEEIAARSQQSFQATDALLSAELKDTTNPQYRLQLLLKQADFLDLYRLQDRLLVTAREGQTLARELRDSSAQLSFQIMEANALTLNGKLIEALRIHQDIAPHLQDTIPELHVRAMLALGRSQKAFTQNELATKSLNQVIDNPNTSITLKLLAMHELAELQINIGLYAKSLDYYHKARELTPSSMKQLALYAEMGVARSLNALKKREEAITKIDPVIKEFHQSGNQSGEAYALLLKGYFYAKLEQFARAETPYLQAAAIYEKLGNPQKISNIYTHLSGNYTAQKKDDRALLYGEKGLALALASDDLILQWDAHAVLARAEAAAGRYKTAYENMQNAFRLFRKSSQQTLDSQTILIREQFDTERKERENVILAEKLAIEDLLLSNKQHEVWILSILAAAMAVTSIALLFAYRRTRYMAQHDGLTGLLNRRQIIRHGEQEFRRARRYNTPLSLVCFDIDHFKEINDKYGHAEGDKVLKCVSTVCKDMVRDSDIVGRLGGEEFLIVLSHSEKDGALKFAERVREKLTEVAQQKIGNEQITASFGVVQMSANDAHFENLLQRADIAMYHAKSRGRNQCSTVDLQVVATKH